MNSHSTDDTGLIDYTDDTIENTIFKDDSANSMEYKIQATIMSPPYKSHQRMLSSIENTTEFINFDAEEPLEYSKFSEGIDDCPARLF